MVCFDLVIKADPDNYTAWSNKAIVLFMKRKNKESFICFDKAVEIDPDAPSVWSNKGHALFLALRYDDAVDALKKSAGA